MSVLRRLFVTISAVVLAANAFGACEAGRPPASLFSTGYNTVQIATGDFDHDGIPDFASANFGSNTISVGLGGSSYAGNPRPTDHTYTTLSNPSAIAAVDYNGDGNLDLVVGFQADTTILIFLGDGHGDFPQTIAVHGPGGSPVGIFGADLNHDGKADLIIGSSLGVAVVYNGGAQGFLQPVGDIGSIATGDLQQDSTPLLAVTTNSTLSILRFNGSNFSVNSTALLGDGFHAVLFEDINGDGKRDVLVGNSGSGILVFNGDGTGGLSTPSTIKAPESPLAIAAGDFDGDGFLDLAATFPTFGVLSFQGSAGGGFSLPKMFPFVPTGYFNHPGTMKGGIVQQSPVVVNYFIVAFPNQGWVELVRPCLDPLTSSASISPAPTPSGWNNSDVTVTLRASARPGASPVERINFIASGAESWDGSLPPDITIPITQEGITTITYSAQDTRGNIEMPKTVTVRIDRSLPTISGMPTNCSLWPPNHQLVTVANVMAAPASATLAVSATSNEPENGTGDGDTGPDILINGGQVQLRAERSNQGNGRIYTITANATSPAGNTVTAAATCTVAK